MIDWTKSMKQTYEFYKVDPSTWKDSELLEYIEGCTIDYDSSNATLGSASIDCTNAMDEGYVRIYLIAEQNTEQGIETQKVALGTVLVQTPSIGFDGKKTNITMDAYTPLIELKGKMPPIGYTVLKGVLVMDTAFKLCRENLRAPVVRPNNSETLFQDFVANTDDNWLSFLIDFMSNAKYQFALDGNGQILFEPIQDMASLRPVWEYNDGNSSILYPEIEDERDLYNVPNVVEVIYSTSSRSLYSRIVNNDPNSPISTVNRGREVIHRVYNPSLQYMPTQDYLDSYAKQLLRDMSCLEHTITYTHGYCPVRVGDCVTLNYERAGMKNIHAKVISQSISCTTGCPVQETAAYTTQLWR